MKTEPSFKQVTTAFWPQAVREHRKETSTRLRAMAHGLPFQ